MPAQWRRRHRGDRPDRESRRDVGLLAVTSADRLHAGDRGAPTARDRVAWLTSATSKNCWRAARDCGIVTVIDGHPAALGWLGSVRVTA